MSKAAKDVGVARIAKDLRGLARPLEKLREDPANARKHGAKNLERITASLRAHGQRKPIVVRKGMVLAGNGTLRAARALGWTHLACSEFEGSEALARAYAVADNASAELAEWDEAALAAALSAAIAEGILDATGFSKEDADEALAAALGSAPRGAADPGPEPLPAKAVSEPGAVYELGPHRLRCGDSTSAADVAALVASMGQDVALIATDPPYGVAYESKGAKKARALSPEATRDLARAAISAPQVKGGGAIYVACPSGTLLPFFIAAFDGSGFVFRHSLVWVKDQFVLARSDYHYRHETILYGWKDGAHYFVNDRKQDSVLEFPRPKRSEEHPTMKPVELYERLVTNSSRPGELVYDPFTGSGTTLMAAARTGRVFAGCELDPRYADVIRRRWTAWARSSNVDAGPGALEPTA